MRKKNARTHPRKARTCVALFARYIHIYIHAHIHEGERASFFFSSAAYIYGRVSCRRPAAATWIDFFFRSGKEERWGCGEIGGGDRERESHRGALAPPGFAKK